MTYLHVQWLDKALLDKLKEEFPRAHLLSRFWTIMHAAIEFLIEKLRQTRMMPVLLPPSDLEARINSRQVVVEATGAQSTSGDKLYMVVSRYVTQGSYEIVRKPGQPFRVIDRQGEGPAKPTVVNLTPAGADGAGDRTDGAGAAGSSMAIARRPGSLLNYVVESPSEGPSPQHAITGGAGASSGSHAAAAGGARSPSPNSLSA